MARVRTGYADHQVRDLGPSAAMRTGHLAASQRLGFKVDGGRVETRELPHESLEDRRTGPRDAPGFGYLYRKVTPLQAGAIASAYAAGVPVAELAKAYGVAIRTIWRAIAFSRQPAVTVRIADWRAEFVITPDGPVRTTVWLAAAE